MKETAGQFNTHIIHTYTKEHWNSIFLYHKLFFCDNLSSGWRILLNFKRNDPWLVIKVDIGLGYCYPTYFQTRGPKVQKLIHGGFIHHMILIVFFFNESLGKSLSQKEYSKWLPFETVFGVWNFSAVLQDVCLDELNVFCL